MIGYHCRHCGAWCRTWTNLREHICKLSIPDLVPNGGMHRLNGPRLDPWATATKRQLHEEKEE